MHSAASSMLLVAPVPRTARSRIPVLGRMIDARVEAAFQAAFDRAEGAILETADRNGETTTYAYAFQRPRYEEGRIWTLAFGLLATLAAGILLGAAVGATAQATGAALLPAIALGCIGFAREAGRARSAAFAGARVAAICSRSIVVALPGRRGVVVRRIPLGAVRHIVRTGGSVVIGLVDEEFALDGLTDPKRFTKDALRCVGNAIPGTGIASFQASATVADREAVEAGAIRRRMRERGWKLAEASDDVVRGEWQILYAFYHPDGLDARGQGGSDLQALRLAEADAVAKARALDELPGASA